MAFVASIKAEKISDTEFIVIDDSSWFGYATSDFSARTVSIIDSEGNIPMGLTEQIDFPIDLGAEDELTIELPKDASFTISITYTPLSEATGDIYTREYVTEFSGLAQSVLAARVQKSEIEGGVKRANIDRYRDVTLVLSRLIDNASYQASIGNLSAAQAALDKTTLIDIDTLDYNV